MNTPDLLVAKSSAELLAYLLAYFFVLRRFADVAQPWRLKLAETGERVLAANPSQASASQISFFLDNAFSGWFMAFSAIALPIAALLGALKHAFGGSTPTPPANSDDDSLAFLFGVSTFAANPLFGTIVLAELALITFLLVVLGSPSTIIRAAMTELVRLETALMRPRGRKAIPA